MRTSGHAIEFPKTLAAFGAVYLIWGSTYLAIKVVVGVLPPLLMAGLRSLTAGVILLAWAIVTREPLPSARHWRNGVVAGALMFLCGHGALFWASQRVASGIAAVLVATIPLWVTVFGLARGEGITARGAAGLLLGIGGVAWLHAPAGGVRISLPASAALLMGSAAWAAAMVWYRGARRPSSSVLAAALPLLGGGVLLLVAAGAMESPMHVTAATLTPRVLGCFAYLVLFGSVLTLSAFTWLLEVASPTAVASYAYVNPVVAVALGWSLGHEPFARAMILPIGLVLAGVTLIVGGGRRLAPVPRPHPAAAR